MSAPPVAKFDYADAMITANQARNQRLVATKRIETKTRADEAARVFQGQVMAAFRPPAGKLWWVNEAAMMIVGPGGGIGTTAAIAGILAPLALGGRHDEAGIAAAAGCRDVVHLRELLTGIRGKLAAVGLRVDRRKAGIRVGKANPTHPTAHAP